MCFAENTYLRVDMIAQALYILFSSSNGRGIPVVSSTMDSTPSPIAVVPKKRSQFDIIWSCLLTLFICTWRTVHPNIPNPKDGSLRRVLGRIKLMLWTLLVPEVILIWAARQQLAAKYMADLEFFKGECPFSVSI